MRWLHDDPWYADAVPKPPIPLETRCRAVELCLSGMQQERAATELGRRRKRAASLDETVPRRRNGGTGDQNGGIPCLRPEPITNHWTTTRMRCAGGYGSWSRGNALMREAVE